MNSDRINQLLKFYEEEPNDPFTIYALAIEYFKNDTESARKYFEILLEKYPDYLPTYYQVAHLYEAIYEEELAIETYEKGMLIAENQKNTNTFRELKNALDELMF
jgi:Tfp pilus assembly protein PilF